jgi:thiol-disulfide isomerase/thioredoxin
MFTRSIFFFLTIGLIISCQSTAQESSTETASIKKASSPPSGNSPVSHLNAPMDVENFPFDIALRKADGTETNSATVLKSKKGPTIISFWLTTCGPCMIEFAAMKKKYAQWESEMDFNFVAISTDFPKNHDAFDRMVKEKDWPWESYLDVNRQFWRVMPGALNGLPQVFVYNKEGEVVYYKRKYAAGDEDILFSKIKDLQ